MRVYLNPINEHFFNTQSKLTEYVRGAFFHGYLPQRVKGISFRSRHRRLAEIVRTSLESEHKIVSNQPNPSSYVLSIQSTPYLRFKIREIGIADKKSEREFPENVRFPDHFLRGFFDAAARLKQNNRYCCVHLSPHFLEGLARTMHTTLGISSSVNNSGRLEFGKKACETIYRFTYQDWVIINRKKMFVPSVEELLRSMFPLDKSSYMQALKSLARINESKKLLLNEVPVEEICEKVGYAHSSGFYLAFQNVTGMTVTEFRKSLQ